MIDTIRFHTNGNAGAEGALACRVLLDGYQREQLRLNETGEHFYRAMPDGTLQPAKVVAQLRVIFCDDSSPCCGGNRQ